MPPIPRPSMGRGRCLQQLSSAPGFLALLRAYHPPSPRKPTISSRIFRPHQRQVEHKRSRRAGRGVPPVGRVDIICPSWHDSCMARGLDISRKRIAGPLCYNAHCCAQATSCCISATVNHLYTIVYYVTYPPLRGIRISTYIVAAILAWILQGKACASLLVCCA